jgi:hypothetical protein
MEITVSKADLESVLRVVTPTVSSTGSDISTHILFRTTETGSEVLAYSGRTFSSCPLTDSVSGTGAFTIEAKRIKLWLGAVEETDLTLSYDDTTKIVTATSPSGDQKFESLDPSNFPYWDQMLNEAEEVGQVEADRLHRALSYTKMFISDQEARNPQLCVTEVRNGSFYATDKAAAVVVDVAGLEKSTMRIHGKDVGSILSYLDSLKNGGLTVYEHPRALVFKRDSDGSLFGESRFATPFPDLNVDRNKDDDRVWVLPKEELVTGINWLRSGAAWEDYRVNFSFYTEGDENIVRMKMRSTSGGDIIRDVACLEYVENNSEEAFPENGFSLNYQSLLDVLRQYNGKTVKFGVNQKGRGGWVRIEEPRNGDSYLTILAWLQ